VAPHFIQYRGDYQSSQPEQYNLLFWADRPALDLMDPGPTGRTKLSTLRPTTSSTTAPCSALPGTAEIGMVGSADFANDASAAGQRGVAV
jgi:hypothetical protein